MRLTFLAFVVFLQGEASHPELHSFPTRRSSDLRWVMMLFASAVAQGQVRSRGMLGSARSTICRPAATLANRLDRKSTRLNSSHRTISYAVFCLKTKNIHS